MEKHSFYLPPEHWGASCVLDGSEARHLSQALRLGAGEEVRLLDGCGREGFFRVEKSDKRRAVLRRLSERRHEPPATRAVMALAWSKAARRDFFMEKAVELSAHEIWFWQGDRSQGRVPEQAKEAWRSQMIAAVKQSGNPWLPGLRMLPGGVEELARCAAEADHKVLLWEGPEGAPVLAPDAVGRPGVAVYVVGPEGSFSERELDCLKNLGFTPVSMGSRVLRCETAALLCLGIHWWASHLPGHAPAFTLKEGA